MLEQHIRKQFMLELFKTEQVICPDILINPHLQSIGYELTNKEIL